MALAEVVAVLRASTGEFTAKIDEAERKLDHLSTAGASSMEKMAVVGKAAFLGIGAAAIGGGIIAVDMADKQEASQVSLQAALTASGIKWESVKGSVAQTGSESTKFGFTQAQIDAALASGVISTQSYSKAHQELQVAVQLAAAKHLDLNTAMSIVEKGANGMLRPLKQMGIDLPIAAGGALKVKQANDALSAAQQKVNADLAAGAGAAAVGSAAHNKYEADVAKVTAAHTKLSAAQDTGKQILDALSQRLGGQAAAAADTFQGKLNAVKAQGENLAATIGLRLIPILEKVMTVVTGVITWFEKHKAVAIALGVVIGGMLTIAIGVWVVGIVAAQVALISAIVTAIIPATAALITFAMTVIAGTWPILLIIAAIVLVGVAVYEVINHWGAIANFFSKVWGDIRKIFFDAWHAVVGFVVGLWNDVTGWFAKLWTELVKWVTRIWTDIKTAFVNGITDVVNFVGGLQAKILGILAGAITWLLNIGSDIISGLWNGIKAGWALLGNIGNTIWGWLKTAVVGAVTWLVQAGSDIVTGLINGISSAWGQVWSFIQGKLSGLMKSVLGFFGISSPSTVFHDIGKNLMVGLANGINAHGGLAQTALTGLSANLTGTLAVNSGIVPLPSVSSSGGGQQVMVATTVMVDGTALLKTLQPAGIQLQRTLSQPYFGSVR